MSSVPARLSLSTGAIAALVGFAALIVALFSSLRSREDKETPNLQHNVSEIENLLSTSRESLQKITDETKARENECAAARLVNEKVKAEIAARAEKLSALENDRNRMLGEAQQNLDSANEASRAEQQAINKSNQERLSQIQLQDMLNRYQNLIVTFCSTSGHLGTGFFYETGQGALVVTSLPPDSLQGKVIMKLRVYLPNQNQLTTIEALGDVLYTDQQTGLSFLSGQFPPSFQVRRLGQDAAATANAGDRVYAIGTQLLGDGLLENNVLDGDVSATDRTLENRTYMQVSIPANDGIRGAPLFTPKGEIVGVLVGAAEGLERTSFAIPATGLSGAATRYCAAAQAGTLRRPAAVLIPASQNINNQNGNNTLQQSRNPVGARSAAETHPLPYRQDESIPFGSRFDEYNFPMAGKDNQLVVWRGSNLRCYTARKPAPVWEIASKERARGIYSVSDNHFWFVPFSKNPRTIQDVDLQSGAEQHHQITIGNPNSYDRIYTTDGAWFAGMGAFGSSFVDPATGEDLRFTNYTILGVNGNHVFAMQYKTVICFDAANVRDMSKQVLAANVKNSKHPYPAFNQENEELQKRLGKEFKGSNIQDDSQQLHCVHIPGSDRVIANLHVLELKGDRLLAAKDLPCPEHSGRNEAWFDGFMGSLPWQPAILAASPNQRWAVSQTHIYDLNTMKAVAELPIPTTYAGFLSDNQTLYLFDSVHSCIYFLSMDQVLAKK